MVQVCSIYLAQPGPAQDWWALGPEERWLGGATLAPPCVWYKRSYKLAVWYKGPRKFRPVPTALQSPQPFSAPTNHQKTTRCQQRFVFHILGVL